MPTICVFHFDTFAQIITLERRKLTKRGGCECHVVPAIRHTNIQFSKREEKSENNPKISEAKETHQEKIENLVISWLKILASGWISKIRLC